MKTSFNKTIRAIKKHPLIYIFIGIVLITLSVISIRFLNNNNEKTPVFVTLKLSQGFWWSKTEKPTQWYLDAIHVGDVQKNFLNNTTAEIISKRTYPYFESEQETTQYDVFLTVKIQADKNPKTNTLLFNRNILAVGSPIELQFPITEISGTVIRIQNEIPQDNLLTEKLITLSLETGYKKEFPFLYNNIPLGDTLFDGQDQVFEIIDKQTLPQYIFAPDDKGNIHRRLDYTWQNVLIKAKIKVKQIDNQLIFGEEQKLYVGGYINLFTNQYNYSNFIIISIEDI